jgi:hypothetical protein
MARDQSYEEAQDKRAELRNKKLDDIVDRERSFRRRAEEKWDDLLKESKRLLQENEQLKEANEALLREKAQLSASMVPGHRPGPYAAERNRATGTRRRIDEVRGFGGGLEPPSLSIPAQ